jgi:HlyD family secretion protein
MKKFIVTVLLLAAVGVAARAYLTRKGPEPQVTTMPVSRGDVVETVGATGTLQAVTTVDVGTQVSGLVQELYADFNSIVRKGQVIARLDPSLIQTRIEQSRASVVRAEADVDRLRVSLADARQKLARAQELSARNLIPRTELETAEVNVKSAEAQIRSSEAGLVQARANLTTEEVNLQHTVITSPIDGIVISRNVDPGQTVAASMNAPVLYKIAADLTKMQVVANIDEADVGRMRPDQVVRFRVDAYPTDEFVGAVEQVRLQPAVVQNVVVYSTVIAVPNPELKLKPGMTANVNIEIARAADVLRIPNAALRFRPTEEMFAALNQEVPTELQRGGGRGAFAGMGGSGRGGANGQAGEPVGGTAQSPGAGAQAAAPGQAPGANPPDGQSRPAAPQRASRARDGGAPGAGADSPEGRGGGDRADQQASDARGGRAGFGGRGGDPNLTPEERRRRFEERMAAMTPEQREEFAARMRARGGDSGRGGEAARQGTGQAARGAGRDVSRGIRESVTAGSSVTSGATTIDSLFAPIQLTETSGRAWLYMDKRLKPVRLRLGITDGSFTQVISEELQPGQDVVINLVTGLESQARPGQQGSQNPLMGPQRGGRGGMPTGGGQRR